jgi:diadenosine tetraphosphate (Ap4A) HIT family hydrolase
VKTTNDEIVRIISINLIILRFIYFSGAYQLITYINKKENITIEKSSLHIHPRYEGAPSSLENLGIISLSKF